jgi:hypothetical protein
MRKLGFWPSLTHMYGPAPWMAEVADMYPAYLIGSRAAALMGIRTHLLVSLLADRVASKHLGHQTPDAFIDPFHAFSLSRT